MTRAACLLLLLLFLVPLPSHSTGSTEAHADSESGLSHADRGLPALQLLEDPSRMLVVRDGRSAAANAPRAALPCHFLLDPIEAGVSSVEPVPLCERLPYHATAPPAFS